jgi:hypothetical protein
MIVKNISGRPLRIQEIMKIIDPGQVFELPLQIARNYKQFLLPVEVPEIPQVNLKRNTVPDIKRDFRDQLLQELDPLLLTNKTTEVNLSNIDSLIEEVQVGQSEHDLIKIIPTVITEESEATVEAEVEVIPEPVVEQEHKKSRKRK